MQLVDAAKVREIVDSRGTSYKAPWFGQLMTGPKMMAYLIQMNIWLEEYKVQLGAVVSRFKVQNRLY